MGTGGGQQGSDGDRPKAQRPKYPVNLLERPGRELAFEGFLSSFASKPVGDVATAHRTNRRHQGVVKPQLLLARRRDDRQHIHASRERITGVVEQPERNKAQSAEVKGPAPQTAGCGWCYDGENLASDHLHSKTVSILARRTLRIPATSDILPRWSCGYIVYYTIRLLIEPEEVAGSVK